MSNKLVYGRVYLFEMNIPLNYRIFIPVVFRGVDLPNDHVRAKHEIKMKTKIPMIDKIDHRVAVWHKDMDDMVMRLENGRSSDTPFIPFDILMYSFYDFHKTQDRPLISNLTFDSIEPIRKYVVDNIDATNTGDILPLGISYSDFIIKSSTLDSGDTDRIREAIRSFVFDKEIK